MRCLPSKVYASYFEIETRAFDIHPGSEHMEGITRYYAVRADPHWKNALGGLFCSGQNIGTPLILQRCRINGVPISQNDQERCEEPPA
jgi:hypothetical protein